MLIDVILPLGFEGVFTYSVPPELSVEAGMRVVVPLANRQMVGVVYCEHTAPLPDSLNVRDIIEVLDHAPCVLPMQFRLWQWIADYYLCTIGQVMDAALPARIKTAKHSRKRKTQEVPSTPSLQQVELTEAQTQAVESLYDQWQNKSVCLLHGVTSSGKTEIYMHLIQNVLDRQQQVLYLVPEIALTTQLTERLSRVFGDRMCVYHSRLNDTERMMVYAKCLSGDVQLVVGVRSSLFLPFHHLGLIVMDEEHDASYKQQDPAPRYHARSVAIMLAGMAGAKVLLGTATPAIESYYNALNGKYGLTRLTTRYAGLALPDTHLVDLRRQYEKKEMNGHFSNAVIRVIQTELERGKQVLIFQNRRGFAAYIECKACGYVPKCEHCDVSLTYHKRLRSTPQLTCHYCGYSMLAPQQCPNCKEGTLGDRGFGTEKIEEEIEKLFPTARVARMDLDTTRNKHGHEEIIGRFERHEVDILIGTQMITKGLHFDDVSLVVVLKADMLMNMPDFRARERAYQMLEQVAGRAGRTGQQGQVIMQTTDAQNTIFYHIHAHDYDAFYKEELEQRQLFHYPPFYRTMTISIRHHNATMVNMASRSLQERLHQVFGDRCSNTIIPVISRVQNAYVREIQLKIEANVNYQAAKQRLMEQVRYVQSIPSLHSINIVIDVDVM